MGLGQKIKNALGDHHDTPSSTSPTTSKHTGSTAGNYKSTPGSFPSDELPARHTDGKEYVPPHGAALNEAKWKETAPLSGAGAGTGAGVGAGAGALSSSGTQRNRLSKGPGDYDAPHSTESKFESKLDPRHHGAHESGVTGNAPYDQTTTSTSKDHGSKGAYWGDLSQGGQGQGSATHGDLTDRTRTHGGHHMPRDEAVGGGTYNQHSHVGTVGRDTTEDSNFGGEGVGTARVHAAGGAHRDHLPAQSGAGIHQSNLSSGTSDPYSSRTGGAGQHGLSSGNNYDQQDSSLRGDRVPSSQHERTGHGHGLAGAGAAAGVGAAAAGYGAHEYGQHNKHDNVGQQTGNTTGGVPRSSMLDPEPGYNTSSNAPTTGGQYSGAPSQPRTGGSQSGAGFNNSNVPTSAYNSGNNTTGYNDPEGTHGPHSSRVANVVDPRVDSDRDHRGAQGYPSGGASNINTGASGPHSGFGSSGAGPASPTQSASSGSGRKHFGPGHEGAKVMHSCEHCGKDNDISNYFSKDVVYRLGQ